MHEHLDLLRREFEADQGTFLLGLRGEGLEWDKAAFSRFEKAMRWACEHSQDSDQLDRWMAEGFYYTSWFVRDWTSHPGASMGVILQASPTRQQLSNSLPGCFVAPTPNWRGRPGGLAGPERLVRRPPPPPSGAG